MLGLPEAILVPGGALEVLRIKLAPAASIRGYQQDSLITVGLYFAAAALAAQLDNQIDFEHFFAQAPQLNPARAGIKGVVCGVRLEEIEEPTMREIRYLDKLIDELAKGRAMEKILRTDPSAGC